ncbi:DUF2249 domain-containing protein [Halobaculum rarum]|uniref:DUF2249 domain-containing protein n=1 Tax=Halobaculum rarum TaxID=3075122 RepID=UPI0032AF12B5
MAHADPDAADDDAGTGTDTEPTIDADSARVLDVRESDSPPFERITSALGELDPDETLVIVNSFEPEPLYAELDRRGFAHRATQLGPDEWRVAVEYE